MEKLKQALSKVPNAFFVILTVMVILWLTLMPKPLGDDPPKLFEGADKVVHCLMFGGLTMMLLLDWQRYHKWEKVRWQLAVIFATISSLLGTTIEFLQENMGLGRGFEISDIISDTVGSFLFAWIWMTLQKFWCVKRN